jgi:hypothetical protein
MTLFENMVVFERYGLPDDHLDLHLLNMTIHVMQRMLLRRWMERKISISIFSLHLRIFLAEFVVFELVFRCLMAVAAVEVEDMVDVDRALDHDPVAVTDVLVHGINNISLFTCNEIA